jgi:hypothetical protein
VQLASGNIRHITLTWMHAHSAIGMVVAARACRSAEKRHPLHCAARSASLCSGRPPALRCRAVRENVVNVSAMSAER